MEQFPLHSQESSEDETHEIPHQKFIKGDHNISTVGPAFGIPSPGYDLFVADHCDTNNDSFVNLGYSYLNHTGLSGSQVFTERSNFTVKEIEVFKVII
jgi:hypothetical protein